MKVTIAILAVAAILVTTVVMTTTIQKASADKVGPHGDAEDNVKQGALGEFFSKDGRDFYTDGELDGVGQSGREHGEQTQTFARPGDHPGGHESFPLDGAGGGLNSLGENFAFYGSGTCHARTPPCE
jgi:hypothetical protein